MMGSSDKRGGKEKEVLSVRKPMGVVSYVSCSWVIE